MGPFYEQAICATGGLYLDRTPGRHCDHSDFSRPAVARPGPREEQSDDDQVQQNMHQQAIGFHMYADDNLDSYPVYPDWGELGGTTGTMTLHDAFKLTADKRPLNKYVPAVQTFHCPSDKGDSLWKSMFPRGTRSCYDAWGNSYLTVWAVETLRVKHVTGNSMAAKGTPDATPMKTSEIARSPSNKLIQGEWPRREDRDKNEPWSQWQQ